MSTFALNNAKREVQYFSDQSKLMTEHHEAMEACDCDLWLQVGIDAFDWIHRADSGIRKAVYSGKDFGEDFDSVTFRDALAVLFASWLEPCDATLKWIKLHEDRGYELENEARFKTCYEDARDYLEQLGWDELARKNRTASADSDQASES